MTAQDDAGPLLETKLYIPRPRRGLVTRPRLSERLSRGAESKLTLVSAPGRLRQDDAAGRVARDPLARRAAAAWLSLDPSDNRAASFWPYVIAALQTVVPEVGATALSLLESPQPPIESVLAPLAQRAQRGCRTTSCWCSTTTTSIDAHDIQDGMAFLLEHLPPQMHLVIATRADPALPLARLRGRGELVEIRAADLRFTPEEAAAYLNEVMGLDLDGAGCRGAGGADRGLDRRPATGGALDPGPRRRRRLHRRLCRGRSLHRRLPGRRGPAASARTCPQASCCRPPSWIG